MISIYEYFYYNKTNIKGLYRIFDYKTHVLDNKKINADKWVTNMQIEKRHFWRVPLKMDLVGIIILESRLWYSNKISPM